MSEVLFFCRIEGRAKSKKNSKQIFKNKKTGRIFILPSNDFKVWSLNVKPIIKKSKSTEIITYPCNLSVKAHYKNHAHEQDLDNVISSICDILEDCEVIKNDNLFYSYNGSCKYFNCESEYIELTITKL